MLDNPKCMFYKGIMLGILKNTMQDTMNYPWGNARAFYELVGFDGEKSVITWYNSDQVRDMRLQYARTKREQQATAKPAIGGASINEMLHAIPEA